MFGDNLKKFRTQKGFSQSDMAKKLYVSRQCVSKWEKGITQPDLQTLVQISEILNVTVDELLKNAENAAITKTENKNSVLFTANILIAIFCSLAFIILFRFLPQNVPVHWTNGKIDRYGSSKEILINLVTPAIFLITDTAAFLFLRKTGGKAAVYSVHAVIALFQTAYLIFIFVLYAGLTVNAISFSTCLCADTVACVSVAMHPKLNEQNKILGVRVFETLNSPAVWKKANALACYLFTAGSAAILVVNMIFVLKFAYLCFLIYLIFTVITVVYSKLVYRAVQ